MLVLSRPNATWMHFWLQQGTTLVTFRWVCLSLFYYLLCSFSLKAAVPCICLLIETFFKSSKKIYLDLSGPEEMCKKLIWNSAFPINVAHIWMKNLHMFTYPFVILESFPQNEPSTFFISYSVSFESSMYILNIWLENSHGCLICMSFEPSKEVIPCPKLSWDGVLTRKFTASERQSPRRISSPFQQLKEDWQCYGRA